MKNFLQRCGLGILILACTVGAARAQQCFPPLDFADDLAALGTMVVDAQGRLLAEPLIGLITPDFYNLLQSLSRARH